MRVMNLSAMENPPFRHYPKVPPADVVTASSPKLRDETFTRIMKAPSKVKHIQLLPGIKTNISTVAKLASKTAACAAFILRVFRDK